MPFAYDVAAGANYASSGTPNTEDAYLALRQATRGFDLQALYVVGKGAALTTLSGIAHRIKRWTTAGSGGTALTPAPRRVGTTASTTAADKQTALTPGTVSGAIQLAIGHGAAGPGGWVAPNPDSTIHVEGGGSDELAFYSASGTASLNFEASCEIVE